MIYDPPSLAKKIANKILVTTGDVPYQKIKDWAIKENISLGILDNALAILHRNKAIQNRVIKDQVVYRTAQTPTPRIDQVALLRLEWQNNNPYPYPTLCANCNGQLCADCFPFYNPERDTIEQIKQRLIMTKVEYKKLQLTNPNRL